MLLGNTPRMPSLDPAHKPAPEPFANRCLFNLKQFRYLLRRVKPCATRLRLRLGLVHLLQGNC